MCSDKLPPCLAVRAIAGRLMLMSYALLLLLTARPYAALPYLQDVYNMLPLLLSPVLGNPVSLAAVGVDRSKSLPEQVSASARRADCHL